MTTYSTLGITLQVHKYKGTGRVVTYLTPDRGKVEAVAQGIGRAGSKLTPAVELFTLSRLLLAEGRDLDRLSQAEVIESHYALRQDMTRLTYASYIAELTANTSEPREPMPGLFERLAGALSAFCDSSDPEPILWWYLLGLFEIHGLAPNLDVCCRCRTSLDGGACYVPAEAGLVCTNCLPQAGAIFLSPEACGVLRSIKRMAPERLPRITIGAEARAALRRFLDAHTDHQFGVATKSRRVLRQLRGNSEAG